jgi:hypothetical protein
MPLTLFVLRGREFHVQPGIPSARFSAFVDKIDFCESGCWLWTGKPTKQGYGSATYQNKTCPAHRLAWRFLCGDIDKGLHLHHKCKNTVCVNPEHLAPVTPEAHALLEAEARHVAVCPEGHAMTPENTYTYPGRQKRRCRACHNSNMADLRRNPRQLKTACYRGHEFTEANTKWYQGRRYCRACHAENTNRYYHEGRYKNTKQTLTTAPGVC